MVPYHYHSTKADTVSAIHNKTSPQRPGDPRLTDRRWDFMEQCWLPPKSRPSMTEVLEFCKRELSDAMKAMVPELTPPTGVESMPSHGPPVGKPSVTTSVSLESELLSSGQLLPNGLPVTRMSGQSLTPVSGQPPMSRPPSGLPAMRLSGTPSNQAGPASRTLGGFSTTRLSGPPARMSNTKPLLSAQRGLDMPLKGKDR